MTPDMRNSEPVISAQSDSNEGKQSKSAASKHALVTERISESITKRTLSKAQRKALAGIVRTQIAIAKAVLTQIILNAPKGMKRTWPSVAECKAIIEDGRIQLALLQASEAKNIDEIAIQVARR